MRGVRIYLLVIVFFQLTPLHLFSQKKKGKSEIAVTSKKIEAEYYFTEGEKFFILEDYAKALAMFQESLKADPTNDAAHFKKAQIELKEKKYSEAATSIRKALQLNRSNKYYYLLLIDAYSQLGEFEDASRIYEEMYQNVKGTETYLFELAGLYMYLKEYSKALDTYDRLEQRLGPTQDIFWQKHRIYKEMGKKEEAGQELERLISLDPTDENSVVAFAEYLIATNQDLKAAKVLQVFIEENTTSNKKASLLLGDLLRKEGDFQRSAEYLTEAFLSPGLGPEVKIQLLAQYRELEKSKEFEEILISLSEALINTHPEVPNTYAVYGDILQSIGKPSLAADQYEKCVNIDPSSYAVWQNLLLIRSQLGQHSKVIEHSEKALEYFPNNSFLYYLNGFSNLRKKEFNTAVQMLQTGRRLAGSDQKIIADFNGLLGEAYNGTREFEKSDNAFEQVLAIDPNNYLILNNYSYYLSLRSEKLELAEKMSAKLIKDNPENATYLDTYAWVLHKRGKNKEAKKIIEKAIEINNDSAIFHEHLGDILSAMGEREKAIVAWKKALELSPDNKDLQKKIKETDLNEE